MPHTCTTTQLDDAGDHTGGAALKTTVFPQSECMHSINFRRYILVTSVMKITINKVAIDCIVFTTDAKKNVKN